MRLRLINLACWLLWLIGAGTLIWSASKSEANHWVGSDIGWQWLLGRSLVQGELDQQYTVAAGERWLAQGYQGKDLEQMTQLLFRKGRERLPNPDGIDGPLYPPTAAFFFAPYGMVSPQQAHTVAVVAGLIASGATALLLSSLMHAWGWSGLVALGLFWFPHQYTGILIGQNHTYTLFLITAGWWLNKRNKPLLAGIVWGLLVYKPVFLVALALVPVALQRWKLLLGMFISALVLVLLTLPFTKGLEPWKRWMTVGQRASAMYELDRRWVWLSRDLSGLPRRAMWDLQSFTNEWRYLRQNEPVAPEVARTYLVKTGTRMQSPQWASMTGWILLIGIAFVTLLVLWWRDEPDDADPLNVALLMTGSLWCVLHFMYYDQLVFALPIALLIPTLHQRKRWWRVTFVILLSLLYFSSLMAFWYSAWWLLAMPFDAFVLLLLWLLLAISAAFPGVSTKIWFFPSDYTP